MTSCEKSGSRPRSRIASCATRQSRELLGIGRLREVATHSRTEARTLLALSDALPARRNATLYSVDPPRFPLTGRRSGRLSPSHAPTSPRRTARTASANVPGRHRARGADELRACLEWITVPAGVALMNEGEAGDAMYLVLSGRLRAYVKDDEGRRQAVREMGRGQIVGEMSVITGEPRRATVVTVRDSRPRAPAQGGFRSPARDQPAPVGRDDAADHRAPALARGPLSRCAPGDDRARSGVARRGRARFRAIARAAISRASAAWPSSTRRRSTTISAEGMARRPDGRRRDRPCRWRRA